MARCSNSRRKSAGRKATSAGHSKEDEDADRDEGEDKAAEVVESEIAAVAGILASANAIARGGDNEDDDAMVSDDADKSNDDDDDDAADKLAHSATAAADGAHGSHAHTAARMSSASSSGWCERRCATTHSSAGTSAGR